MVPGKQKATLSSGLVLSSSYPCGCALSYTRRASSRFASIRFRSALRRQDKARSLRSFVSIADAYAMPTNLPAVVAIVSSNFTPTQRRATKLAPLPLSQAASGLARLDQAQGEVHVWLVFRRGPSDTDEMDMDGHVRPGESSCAATAAISLSSSRTRTSRCRSTSAGLSRHVNKPETISATSKSHWSLLGPRSKCSNSSWSPVRACRRITCRSGDRTGPDGRQIGPSDFAGGGVLRPPFAKLRRGRFDGSLRTVMMRWILDQRASRRPFSMRDKSPCVTPDSSATACWLQPSACRCSRIK